MPAAFAPWRDRVAALRPQYFRLLVDWARVQPRADAPPDFASAADGCLRGTPPCAPYAGVRDVLRAVRERAEADGGWEIVVVPFHAPAWAVRSDLDGCGRARAPRAGAYRALIAGLRDLARAEGLALRWWAPWNEPNHPVFLNPQRARCAAQADAVSPDAYADLVRALHVEVPEARLVIGEVAGYDRPRARAVGAAEFARALPRDVACAGEVWGQHAYVRPEADGGSGGEGASRAEDGSEQEASGDEGASGADDLAGDPSAEASLPLVADVLAALDAHRCPRPHRVWITETGVGGPRTGETRPLDAAALRADCRAMAAALDAWGREPRVDAAFQYTFREDPAFPVGLADAGLTRLYDPYEAWRRWGRPGAPPGPAC